MMSRLELEKAEFKRILMHSFKERIVVRGSRPPLACAVRLFVAYSLGNLALLADLCSSIGLAQSYRTVVTMSVVEMGAIASEGVFQCYVRR